MTIQTLPELYVLDVCGTLVHDDTTVGLLNHHFLRSTHCKIRRAVFYLCTTPRSPFRMAFMIVEKLSNSHFLKYFLVAMLAGERYEDLEASADEYAKELLQSRRVLSVWKKIQNTAQGGQLLLASASLEPVVKSLADAIGARYVASTLETRNGVLTGRYLEDLTGNKELAITKKYGSDLLSGLFTVFSDNLSDSHLLEIASKAFVILHNQKHRERWRGFPVEFIKADE